MFEEKNLNQNTEHYEDAGFLLFDSGLKQNIEQRAEELVANRRNEAWKCIDEGKTLQELLEYFDNDYQLLEELYKEKTGGDLIMDPDGSSQHEVSITKTCSVIVPVYNGFAQLEKCLLSLQNSTFNAKYPTNFEVLVVDDGSSRENISELVASSPLHDLSVKVLVQENGQRTKAVYSGALEATGDICLVTCPDIIFCPTAVEEFMKRHQVLEGVALFGFRDEIDMDDVRITPDAISNGSLSLLPLDVGQDPRISNQGLADSDWLKDGGNNTVLPIDVEDEAYHQWRLVSIPWGFSISCSREDLVRTQAGYEEGRGITRGDDEDSVSRLIGLGNFIIPNTAAFSYHIRHDLNYNEEDLSYSREVIDSHLMTPVRDLIQDSENPLHTNAMTKFSKRNERIDARTMDIPHLKLSERGAILENMGLHAQAETILSECIEAEPDNTWAKYDRARAYLALGERHGLIQASTDIQEMVKCYPERAGLLITLAEIKGRLGDYDSSLELYRQSYDGNPSNVEIFRLSENELHEKGALYLKSGKPLLSLKYYDLAIAKCGGIQNAPWSAFDKSVALRELGQIEDALELQKNVTEIMPDNSWVTSSLGVTWERIGDTGQAHKYFSKALELDVENSEALKGLLRLGT